jgi:hypothetical protein
MTLTELSATAAIVSTLLAIGAPSFIHIHQSYLLHSAARAVAGSMHVARIAAVTRNRDCRVAVPSAAVVSIECQAPVWQMIESTMMPHGMVLTPNAKPTFHARGNVAPAGTVKVCNRFDRCLKVIVNVNGRVRIQ